jgi:hypothetical protein
LKWNIVLWDWNSELEINKWTGGILAQHDQQDHKWPGNSQ